jgi:hypothetical protein
MSDDDEAFLRSAKERIRALLSRTREEVSDLIKHHPYLKTDPGSDIYLFDWDEAKNASEIVLSFSVEIFLGLDRWRVRLNWLIESLELAQVKSRTKSFKKCLKEINYSKLFLKDIIKDNSIILSNI